jgi:hypothetical protein
VARSFKRKLRLQKNRRRLCDLTVPIAKSWVNYIFLVLTGALNDVDTVARHRRPLALWLPPQAAQMEPGAVQRPRDRAVLIARYSGDQNRPIACHA